jgi:hypothetical protein
MPAPSRQQRGRCRGLWPALATAFVVLVAVPPAAAQPPTPESHFGFRMGADRRLATAEAIEKYFEIVAAATNRVKLVEIGLSTEGRRTIAALISAPENIQNLEQIRAANRRLADPRTLPPDEARKIAASHKAVLAIGCSIHASEIGATQAANELLHWLATSQEPATLNVLQNTIIILIPTLNPDGHRLVVDWYERQKGTSFEGSPMPWLYHKYAGHDINRDAFMMNMAENRNLARFFYTEWHPQVFLTMHQMGQNGPRFFVPPNVDPIDENYDPIIWRTASLLGSAMALELQRDGRSGVLSNAMYDYYWPGYEDSAPLGHNTVCLLTEVASVRVASPITVKPEDLRAGQKGFPDHKPQINFPDPWPGGSWTLRHIVEYNSSAVRGLVFAVAAYREQIVQNFYEMGRRAVEAGRRGGPFAFIIPPEQHDRLAQVKLQELLLQGAVEIQRAIEPFRADGEPYPAGTDIIFMAQPFRAYAKTLLERQRYPAKPTPPGTTPERPYDVAGWTLPQQMGVDVRLIERTFEPPPMSRVMTAAIEPAAVWGERRPDYYVVDARGNGGAIAANRLTAGGGTVSWLTRSLDVGGVRHQPGALVVPFFKGANEVATRIAKELGLRVDGVRGRIPADARPIGRARIALYKPWVDNQDEGWTRWVLENHEFRFATVNDPDVRAGNLRSRFDVIIVPNAAPDRLKSGYSPGAVPPEFVGGLGEAGVDALKQFVESGGTLVCLDQACSLPLDLFGLPVRDVARADGARVFGPGSILRLQLDPSHPLTFGMPPETAAFFVFSGAFEPAGGTSTDGRGAVHTVARYADKDLLMSGWLEGGDAIAGRSAVLQAEVGAGRVVVIGFRVQHRGQSLATFRLLFNALLQAVPPK